MITAITPTGDRLLTLGLLAQWIAQQTVPVGQWIVVDDGAHPYRPVLPCCEYLRRAPRSDDPKHTLNLNVLTALPYVKGDKVLILEDDEYYGPRYVEEMSKRLDCYEVVGIGHSKYYHLPSRGYSRHANIRHASLAQTGFRASFAPHVATACKLLDRDYLDVRIWRAIGGRIEAGGFGGAGYCTVGSMGLVFRDEESLYCGMKGLPGRSGIGIGHKTQTYKQFDRNLSVLKSWVPGDYRHYTELTSV